MTNIELLEEVKDTFQYFPKTSELIARMLYVGVSHAREQVFLTGDLI